MYVGSTTTAASMYVSTTSTRTYDSYIEGAANAQKAHSRWAGGCNGAKLAKLGAR